jgi:hypothetical protein
MGPMLKRYPILLAALSVLAFSAGAATSNKGNGGGLLRENIAFEWQSSLGSALSWAKSNDGPVMLVISTGTELESKMIDKVASWPQSIELSRGKMAAVKTKVGSAEATDALGKLSVKPPCIAFLDKNGNPLAGMPIPEAVQPIAQAVAGWKTLSGNIDAFFKDHETRGSKYLDHSKLKEAYLEYSFGAPFKGAEADKSRAGKTKIEDAWMKLFDLAAKMPSGSIGQQAIFKGLRKDTFGTAFAPTMEMYIKTPELAANRGSGAAPAIAAAAAPQKSLAELARGGSSLVTASRNDDGDDSVVESSFLLKSGDPRLKQAEQLLQEGIAEYKKATADSTERGPARNALLQSAHTKFDKTLSLCEEATKAKPDAQVEKLMEKTSMLMYGTLKYQSL